MHFRTNILFKFFTAILLISSVQNTFAQYPGMQAVYSRMSMQDAQMHMNSMNAMMSRMNDNKLYNYKYVYYVTLKDSSKLTVASVIYTDTSLHKDYLLLVDKKYPKSDTAHRNRKIYAEQTLEISRVEVNGYRNSSVYANGFPTDTCWLFKAISGPITAYSYLSEKEGMAFDPATIVAIQLNDGPIINFDEKNLKQMISQDKDAMEYFDKKKYYKALKRYNKDTEKATKK